MSRSDLDQATTSSASPAESDAAGVRFRVRYEKVGKLRFVSAIDLGRLWERALRKARLPIAYSEGFSPHPKVSFPDALPLGYASTGEYAELTFAAPVTIDGLMRPLNDAFPDGLAVLDVVGVAGGASRLSKWLAASVWDLDYPAGAEADALAAAAQVVLGSRVVTVARERKGEITETDARPAIAALATRGRRLRALVRHVEPPIRPSELHQALAPPYEASTGTALPDPALVKRVAQGTLTGDVLTEALSGAIVAVHDLTATSEAAASSGDAAELIREDDLHRD